MKVFDASAVLALLAGEPGADATAKLMEAGDGVICAANFAEVITKLIDRGLSEALAAEAFSELPLQIESLTAERAAFAARLRKTARSPGLSLGDRCCLALGQMANAPVITADRAWKTVKGSRITLIR